MALYFNGTSDYVDAGNSPALQKAALTYSCWVNLASLANAYTGVICSNGTNFYEFFVKSNGKLAIYLNSTSGISSYDGTGSNTLSINTFYHLALTYNSAAGLVGYVNGASDGTGAAQGPLNSYDVTSFLNFGKDPANAGRLLSGSLSHVAVYSTALSASQIALLASGLSPLSVSGETLSAYWPLDGAAPARDRGPNGLLATVRGPTAFNDPPGIIAYPRRILAPSFAEGEMPALFTAGGGGGSFLAAWARGSNLPIIGTGNY